MSETYRRHETKGETISSHESKQHHERIKDHLERNAESSPSRSHHETESIRHEVQEQAISGAEMHKPASESRHHQPIGYTKKDKAHAFETTMHHARSKMNKSEKVLSKVIHQPTVEKISDIAGATITRPSGIAGATIASFIGLLFIYGIARFAGFSLSGSEMPLLLLIGFVAGLLFEWIYKSIQNIIASK
jgi:hypothetical protein